MARGGSLKPASWLASISFSQSIRFLKRWLLLSRRWRRASGSCISSSKSLSPAARCAPMVASAAITLAKTRSSTSS
jgi:hypothetical protein